MAFYELVIGLEIHLKLNSVKKLFCGCQNVQDFTDLSPNTHICPVCTGQPGALPVLQQSALEIALKLGKLLNCKVQEQSNFDRKSYFYPDLPSGYQITQFFKPTMIDGVFSCYTDNEFSISKDICIRDAHMEIDTAKTSRDGDEVLIDWNRSGTPLVEVVTEPDFRSTDEVIGFLKELQKSCQWNGVSDAQLEAGQMRCDVNISIRPLGSQTLGTRTEMKNMNSFSAIRRAIEVEYARQSHILTTWGEVSQETRGRDDAKSESYVMRSKEDALDYRYMPEPDLPSLAITHQMREELALIPTLSPYICITDLKEKYQFSKEYINTLIGDKDMLVLFQDGVRDGYDPKIIMQWLAGPVAKRMNVSQDSFASLQLLYNYFTDFLQVVRENTIPPTAIKQLFEAMLDTGKSPSVLINELGLGGMSDEALMVIVKDICAQYPAELVDPRKQGFLIGQVVKASGGRADARRVPDFIKNFI
jgi:aspartyl-tRNA(Asn)/glutamyl-tRNA(Gln) amidotransferase subunit B